MVGFLDSPQVSQLTRVMKAGYASHRRTRSLELFRQTTQQDPASARSADTHINLPTSSWSSISWNGVFTLDREKSVQAIYSRIPIFGPGETPIINGTSQGDKNLGAITHDSKVSESLLPSEFATFPREIPENTEDTVTLMKDSIGSVPAGEASSTIKTMILAHGEDLPWDWEIQSPSEPPRDHNELTSSNPDSPYNIPQDTYPEYITNFSQSAWLTSRGVSPIPKRSSLDFLEPRGDSSVRFYGGTISVSVGGNINTQDGEEASSLSENDCPTPAFGFVRNSHDPGNSFVSREINFGTSRMYPFPFPLTEEVPASPLDSGIPPDSLVFEQDPQYNRPREVNLGYKFPQIPRNNPILPYLNVGPLCPATARPPIPNLVETAQISSSSPEDMDVPRSWWHYFYRSVVPSHLFQNDKQPSLHLPELDHWSIEVGSPGDTRPPSLMKETYQERQERRLKRAICNRWIRFQLEKMRNFIVTGPKMAAAVILWVLRWCGLDRSSAGWYG